MEQWSCGPNQPKSDRSRGQNLFEPRLRNYLVVVPAELPWELKREHRRCDG